QISSLRDRHHNSDAGKNYSSEQFRHWLTELAKRLEKEQTQDFLKNDIHQEQLMLPDFGCKQMVYISKLVILVCIQVFFIFFI
ncbi:hypothetical protein V6O07_17620, partial [Arthrospira platensis SPKY2]